MTRYVLDPPTLLEVVARGVQISPDHQIVAPGAIRSSALALLFEAVQRGDLTEQVALEHHESLTGIDWNTVRATPIRGRLPCLVA